MALSELWVAIVLLRQLLSVAHKGPGPLLSVLLLPATELGTRASVA